MDLHTWKLRHYRFFVSLAALVLAVGAILANPVSACHGHTPTPTPAHCGYSACADIPTLDAYTSCVACNGAAYCDALCPTPTPAHCGYSTCSDIPTLDAYTSCVACNGAAYCDALCPTPTPTPTSSPPTCTGDTYCPGDSVSFSGVGLVTINNPGGSEVTNSLVIGDKSFPACPSGAGQYTYHMNLLWSGCYICDSTCSSPTQTSTPTPTGTSNETATPTPTLTHPPITFPTTGIPDNVPVAEFTANITTGNIPLTVQFNDTSSHNPTAWKWNFSDGNYATEQNPLHTYTTAGTYDVTLTASNADGGNTSVKEGYVVVTNAVELKYSITNVESYYPEFRLNLSNISVIPPYYPGRGINTNISSKLQGIGWQPVLIHHDFDVTKMDFGTTGEGLNSATFHYHFGHGNTTHALLLSQYVEPGFCIGQPPDCTGNVSDSISPSEVQWNGNLKWILLDACSSLENLDWAQPMGTTHGVLGFASEKMPSQDLPNLFLQYSLDDNQTVYQSYHDATYYSFTKNVTAAVIFNNYDQFQNDHFPDHGTIVSDEYPNDHSDDYNTSWSCGGGPVED